MSQSNSSQQRKGILTRFGYLLSAQGVDAALSTVFFLYLAWLNSTLYGQVMYALAGAGIVMTIVEFGLYYPLVVDLAANPERSDKIIAKTALLRLILLVPALLFVAGITYYRSFPLDTTLVFWSICLGVAFDALAETFFADLRVKAKQADEAKIKVTATVVCYVYGVVTAALGFPAVIVALFRLVGAAVKIVYGLGISFQAFTLRFVFTIKISELKPVFLAAVVFALIDILGSFYNKTNIFFLEKAAGMTGVAYYTATWSIVDAVSVMASSQFLGWVIFPLLATTFSEDRKRIGPLVRNNALWLIAAAFPIMTFLYVESELLIGLLYPKEYVDAVWMQRYLVWTIPLSFANNLFIYLMMVAGAGRMVLAFACGVTLANLMLNYVLVNQYGLAGACLVIILTKLLMMILTFTYCKIRFSIFRSQDVLFPTLLGILMLITVAAAAYVNRHLAIVVGIGLYSALVYGYGLRFMGKLDGSQVSTG